jgi:hypothetical protein
VQTRRYPGGGATAFILPSRVRCPVPCSALDVLARRCRSARYAVHGDFLFPRWFGGGRCHAAPSISVPGVAGYGRKLSASCAVTRPSAANEYPAPHVPIPRSDACINSRLKHAQVVCVLAEVRCVGYSPTAPSIIVEHPNSRARFGKNCAGPKNVFPMLEITCGRLPARKNLDVDTSKRPGISSGAAR